MFHFSTPVMTTPRMKKRCAKMNRKIGKSIAISEVA